jgi:hypothetical protein
LIVCSFADARAQAQVSAAIEADVDAWLRRIQYDLHAFELRCIASHAPPVRVGS